MALYFGSCLLDILAVIIAIIAVGYAYCLWKFQYWKNRNVPYLEPVVPWGNLEKPFNNTMFIGDEVSNLYEEAKQKGE